MAKLNSIEKSEYINNEYKRYLKASFKFDDKVLQKLYEQQLEEEELFKGPYLDLVLPFKRGKTLQELIDEGIVCKSFKRLGNLNFNRPLYAHQEDALRLINSGHSAVVTTGTGSGKTECFLFPILNNLLNEVEAGNKEVGVRAIFLYPMNALINDQIERVRAILSNCKDITYGFYTGDTPEKEKKNYREDYFKKTGVVLPENELLDRESIRNNPPHLLFTNYSMLEYLLIRPGDYGIISPEHLKNWKYVVLDEAHTYYGSKGIELSLLMRRLTGLTATKPRFILTSATLGEKGKSENDIVKFAQSLTSAGFSVDDIIFSNRIPMKKDTANYVVSGEDILKLKNNIKDLAIVQNICNKYKSIQAATIDECLYMLLSSDKNTYRLYEILKNESKTTRKVLTELKDSLTKTELTALVDLINTAAKDGVGLFDLKYHSFVRPISGAFINLGKEHKLTLTKTNSIDGLKAFEVGNCRCCSVPYIIGKIRHNNTNNIDYLFQNKEIDIYENYGDNEHVIIDYFLLENSADGASKELLDEHIICSKCGAIRSSNNKTAKKCQCGENFEVKLFKVLQRDVDGDISSYNNINKCPCCGQRKNSGIVKLLNIGKDEGTALISQILYEAIDEGNVQEKKLGKITFGAKRAVATQAEQPKVKQFLAFSDSRQQASFAATFMDSTHTRMLRKRLLWHIIEQNSYEDISVDKLVAQLRGTIERQDLFANNIDAEKNAWITVLRDLLRVDGVYDGEGLGLYYFDLDIEDLMESVPNDVIDSVFDDYSIPRISRDAFVALVQIIMATFKTVPAVKSDISGLTQEDREKNLEYRRFDNYVALKGNEGKKNIHSLLPVGKVPNKIVKFVMKACSCAMESAISLIAAIFDLFAQELEEKGDKAVLARGRELGEYQINVSRYRLKNYKKNKFYACEKCGILTPYNVNDACVHDKCDGKLKEINPDKFLSLNYYRQKYKNKKIERVVYKEHTAQIKRGEAKAYQDDFKNKKINILSCSTTFEMGIDIGDLETVFMRNIPPSPANYVQRAGRAGRRKDSSAYILTYCDAKSHDYTYFNEPTKMISGLINPPCFDVQNKKIIVRHLMAASLGFFFRHNKEYFENVEILAFNEGNKRFYEYLNTNPEDLNFYINQRVLPEKEYEGYHNFKWFHDMHDTDEKFEYFVDTVTGIVEQYTIAIQKAAAAGKYGEASQYQKQIDLIKKTNVIEALSKYCVIPKYGFPVDVVELEIYDEKGVKNNKYDLNRDLKIAISEYAPDSEVIVDKEKYTSKYISLAKAYPLPKSYFHVCNNCQRTLIYPTPDTEGKCPICDEVIPKVLKDHFIIPIFGFKTGKTKQTTHLKPARSYVGEISYIGTHESKGAELAFGNSLSVETSSDDELMVMNRSSFYMCPVCGYSDISKQSLPLPELKKKHKRHNSYSCDNEILHSIRIAHKFHTDVAKFTIPALSSLGTGAEGKALSFMYAFLEGISIALNIERDDINGILVFDYKSNSYNILIFDDVPGGAGHVKRLVDKEAIVNSLKAAYDKVSQNCCDENTSCYNCLRNFYNQTKHEMLRRIYAKNIIKGLMKEIEDYC